MIEQLKDIIEHIWKWFLMIWAATYAAFHYLFQPTAAWSAAWSLFLAAFVTKMIQLSYEGKGFWKMLRNRFSGKVALQKAAPKMIFYLLLMFGVARAQAVFPENIIGNLHFVATSFVFVVELLNCLQHLSVLPGIKVGGLIEWIKKTLMPEGIPYDDE